MPGAPPPPGGAPAGEEGEKEKNHAVLLAVAIVLLWLAGLAFFIALEGLQVEQGNTTGSGLLKSMLSGLSGKAAQAEQGQGGG